MARSSDFHRDRMIARRGRQIARQPGFDPMPNRRIDPLFEQAFAKLMITIDDPVQAAAIAVSQVAAMLPARPMARRHREPRASKSDCAIYRKAVAA